MSVVYAYGLGMAIQMAIPEDIPNGQRTLSALIYRFPHFSLETGSLINPVGEGIEWGMGVTPDDNGCSL